MTFSHPPLSFLSSPPVRPFGGCSISALYIMLPKTDRGKRKKNKGKNGNRRAHTFTTFTLLVCRRRRRRHDRPRPAELSYSVLQFSRSFSSLLVIIIRLLSAIVAGFTFFVPERHYSPESMEGRERESILSASLVSVTAFHSLLLNDPHTWYRRLEDSVDIRCIF